VSDRTFLSILFALDLFLSLSNSLTGVDSLAGADAEVSTVLSLTGWPISVIQGR